MHDKMERKAGKKGSWQYGKSMEMKRLESKNFLKESPCVEERINAVKNL